MKKCFSDTRGIFFPVWQATLVAVLVFMRICALADHVLKFNSANKSYVNMNHTFGGFSALTIEVWLKAGVLPADVRGAIAGNGYLGTSEGFGLFMHDAGDVRFQIRTLSNGIKQTEASYPFDNQWHHVAGVYDSNAGLIKIYLDGVLAATEAFSLPVPTSTTKFGLGALQFDGTWGFYYYDGWMAEVRLWDHARSITEINNSKNKRLKGDESGLVGYWPLNEANGGTIYDNSSGSHNGTINNAVWQDDSSLPLRTSDILVLAANRETITNSDTCVGNPTLHFGASITNHTASDLTFIITNQSTTAIHLVGATPVTVSGAGFSLLAQPASHTLEAGKATTFAVRFTPDSLGIHTALVTIASSDTSVPLYSFTVGGVGESGAVFHLSGTNNLSLANNRRPDLPGGTDFGRLPYAAGMAITNRLTVSNNGGVPLELGSPWLTDGTAFELISPKGSMVIPPGGDTPLEVVFQPPTNGIWESQIAITNNNMASSPFLVNLSGVAHNTWYVAPNGNDNWSGKSWSAPRATPASAIGSAMPGDLVLLSNGVYALSQTLAVNKPLVLRGHSGVAAETILDGNNAIRCASVTDPGASIEALTVKRGKIAGSGAGILMTGGTILNCVVISNSATGSQGFGGGIHATGGKISDSIVSHNSASQQGGGLWLGNAALLALSGVSSNRSNGTGGGIYLNDSAIVTNTTVSFNSANDVGGIELSGNTMVLDSQILSNTSDKGSGGMRVNIGSFSQIGHCVISGNSANGGGGGGLNLADGRIYDSLVTSNTAANYYGGGIRLLNGTVENCTVAFNKTTGAFHYGGGIHVQEGGTVKNSVVKFNQCNFRGGGIALYGNGSRLISSTVCSNTASQDGGGVYAGGAWTLISGGNVSGNTASQNGGGVYAGGDRALISGSDVYGNTAGSVGGGVYIDSAATVTNSSVNFNASLANGAGGIYLNAQGLIVDTTIGWNDSTAGSGGVALTLGTLAHSRIVGNVARGNPGGGIRMFSGAIHDCLIASNSVTANAKYGGGLSIEGGAGWNNTILWNTATNNSDGGGVYIANSGTTLRNSLMAGNTATRGGGISIQTGTTVENCTIVRNRGTTSRGGCTGNSGTILNSIVYYNEPKNDQIPAVLGYSCLDIEASLPDNHNIVAAPLFVDSGSGIGVSFAPGDYRLSRLSPCRNSGQNKEWMEGASDLCGAARIAEDVVDMGAYEFHALPPGTTIIMVR